MANVRAKVSSVDPVWERMTQEAEQAIRDEPLLGGQIHSALLHHPSIENALAYRIAMKLTNSEMSEQLIREICDEAYRADPALAAAIAALAANVRPVTDGTVIAPGVSVLHTPGHTAEHTSYVVESAGERLIAFGDAFHCAAQFAHPEWADGMDHDAVSARASRELLLDRLTEPRTYGFGVHFSDVTFGRVVDIADGYSWQPAP